MKHLYFSLLLILAITTGELHARVYTVEILIFERDDFAATDFFPVEPGNPDLSGAAKLEELGFFQSHVSTGQLGPDKYTLRKSGLAKPLYHAIWRQPMPPRHSPTKILISRPNGENSTPPTALNGVISLSVGRFLHIDVDLLLHQKPSSYSNLSETNPAQYFRMISHRKMKSGTLHYIDHPKMGILIRIDRYPKPS